MRGTGRARDVVLPRQIAMYLIRELTPHSLPEIGVFFGRDHSTVLHAISKINESIEKDPELTLSIDQLRRHLSGLEDFKPSEQ